MYKAGFCGQARESCWSQQNENKRQRKYWLCFVPWALVSCYRIVRLQWKPESPCDATTETDTVCRWCLTRAYAYMDPLSFRVPLTDRCLLWVAPECLLEILVQKHWESWAVNKLWEQNGQGFGEANLEKAIKATYIVMTKLQNSGIGATWKILEAERSWSNAA